MKPSERTPVEQTIDMLKQGLEPSTIRLCLGVSEKHARQLVLLARREMHEARQHRHLEYRVNALPGQIANARRKLAALEREAVRLGLHDLVRETKQ